MPSTKKKIHFATLKELNGTTISTSVIAAITGKTIRAIERNSDASDKNYIGLQTFSRGKYKSGEVFKRLLENNKNRIDELQGGTLRNSKERKEAALAEAAEIANAKSKKEIIQVDDAVVFLEKILTSAVSKVNSTKKISIPKLLIAKDDKEVSKILETRDDEFINEITNTITNIIRGMVESADKDYSANRSAKTKK